MHEVVDAATSLAGAGGVALPAPLIAVPPCRPIGCAPGLDAPGVDAPGLDAPGVDALGSQRRQP
jgi:hypothetical protein